MLGVGLSQRSDELVLQPQAHSLLAVTYKIGILCLHSRFRKLISRICNRCPYGDALKQLPLSSIMLSGASFLHELTPVPA